MADERPTLLMIEDDLGLQKQMRWSFDRFNVIFADNRETAIAQLRRHEPAVVTLDLGLPPDPDTTSEGFKTLEEILSLAPTTKVIALTGQNDRSNALRAIGMGAYDFFAKPFEPDDSRPGASTARSGWPSSNERTGSWRRPAPNRRSTVC